MNKNDLIAQWAGRRAASEFHDAVSMVLTYGSYVNGTANALSDVDFYFIPKTDDGYRMSRTFIIDGIGYDLFPMSWQRVEGLADLNESITPCLADVRILYSNSDEDLQRFRALQDRLAVHLQDGEFMLNKASDRLKQAKTTYGAMLFEDGLCETRTCAGYIAMSLSEAVAYANHTYFRRGLKKQIEDLVAMKSIPEDFVNLYEAIVQADTVTSLRDASCQMIKNTGDFLRDLSGELKHDKQPDYPGMAECYEEGISTWNKIYGCCDRKDATLAFISGTCLQHVLDEVAQENGLSKFDLMGGFQAENLEAFRQRAKALQAEFVNLIETGGARIDSYGSAEEFLDKNP